MDLLQELVEKYQIIKDVGYLSDICHFFLKKSFSLSFFLAKNTFVFGKHLSRATFSCGKKAINVFKKIRILVKSNDHEVKENKKAFKSIKSKKCLIFNI